MSSDEEYGHDSPQEKKRIRRACDACRRRKTRCDGSQMPEDKCSTCVETNIECTYLESPAKRVPVNVSNYVESLETRVKSLEARLEESETLVRQLRAELADAVFANSSSTSPYMNGNQNNRVNGNGSGTGTATANGNAEGAKETTLVDGRTASLHIMRMTLQGLTAPPAPPHADDLLHLEIARKFESLSLGAVPEGRVKFLGKSSAAILVNTAIAFKGDAHRSERRASEFSNGPSTENGEDGDGEMSTWRSRRLYYWNFKPWEQTRRRPPAYSFPPRDLAAHLIELYFTHVNVYLPLLHRPTFERAVEAGLHLRDDGFAATLLLVCAVASRWSDDPRVVPSFGTESMMPPGAYPYPGPPRLACGWAWFSQVPLVEHHLFAQATLYDLQCYCLAVQYLESLSAPQASWTLIGVGLRLAQDVGAHRRTPCVEKPSVERELWKRAFWVLVFLDRSLSSGMGRTCAIQHDDFDQEPPLEVDDEYWEHPTRPFMQPVGVPSRVAFFATLLRLNHILSFSLKTLYSLMKVRSVYAVDDAWEENVVVELDSALNRWRDEVPEHLRWDPARTDPVFFDQSVALHCHYSHLQILIHRPFIPTMRKSAPIALPSLAICTSAARTCANMVDVQRRRKGNVPVAINLTAVFTSGIVLLLNMWSGKRTGLVPDPSREITNVHKCMEVVRLCEDRWQNAGILWDILYELSSVGQLPLSNPATREIPACVQPGSRQTFEYPMSSPPFRAPYAPYASPVAAYHSSFAGVSAAGGGAPGVAAMEPSAFAPSPPPDTWLGPEEFEFRMNTDPAQASRELEEMMRIIDNDTISMWANAPTGVEVDGWGNYLSNFSEIAQGQPVMHGNSWGLR
ncbi:fungal-specific transcription factor domain-containing protein [Mycena latifolia]|nr:fungal-specific transcription factor domain-containing protein [Mycena latifolia]